MAVSSGPATGDQWRDETRSSQDRQDGLLPVIKFLQSALAMKAKVSLGVKDAVVVWELVYFSMILFRSYDVRPRCVAVLCV